MRLAFSLSPGKPSSTTGRRVTFGEVAEARIHKVVLRAPSQPALPNWKPPDLWAPFGPLGLCSAEAPVPIPSEKAEKVEAGSTAQLSKKAAPLLALTTGSANLLEGAFDEEALSSSASGYRKVYEGSSEAALWKLQQSLHIPEIHFLQHPSPNSTLRTLPTFSDLRSRRSPVSTRSLLLASRKPCKRGEEAAHLVRNPTSGPEGSRRVLEKLAGALKRSLVLPAPSKRPLPR